MPLPSSWPASIKSENWLQVLQESHHAAQLISMAARSYLPDSEEDLWANLGWSASLAALVTHPLKAGNRFQLGLSLAVPSLLAIEQEQIMASFPLAGQTWAAARHTIVEWVRQQGFPLAAFSERLPYALPGFPRTDDQVFPLLAQADHQAFSDHFALAVRHLGGLCARYPEASEIRCWPHHFDIATLLSYPDGKSIGIGLSPGDESCAEPYFYTNLWPVPDLKRTPLPLLSVGIWHTGEWVGAILKASEIHQAVEQESALATYQQAAIEACQALLGIAP